MIPIALDPRRSPVAVAGRGEAIARRIRLLATGASSVQVFTDDPDVVASLPGSAVLHDGLPGAIDFSGVRALWIAGLNEADSAALATCARQCGVLVNVEDRPALCDFHSVAELRRGDLLIAVSTGGQSPGLAARIRTWLAGAFGPEWASHTAQIGAYRNEWRRQGASIAELARMTDEIIEARAWMP